MMLLLLDSFSSTLGSFYLQGKANILAGFYNILSETAKNNNQEVCQDEFADRSLSERCCTLE